MSQRRATAPLIFQLGPFQSVAVEMPANFFDDSRCDDQCDRPTDASFSHRPICSIHCSHNSFAYRILVRSMLAQFVQLNGWIARLIVFVSKVAKVFGRKAKRMYHFVFNGGQQSAHILRMRRY